ncbi:hypothetical protein L2E82_37254 [Cichorium intybus]|uniref:Uncharacterized protein n=1 Tax=Cichorium intybus TaxID=13427 RepID=A0ACB9ADX7_CICIN|nr:hypothetical protein L2E82_37254 [Cichorium intybus]
MKGDVGGKMIIKSKLKWVGLVGLVLSVLSLFTHFLLARYSYTNDSITEYQAITIFSWRPIFENADLSSTVILLNTLFQDLILYSSFIAKCTEDYGAVRRLESLQSHAKPRECYSGLQIPRKTGLYITSFHHNFSTNPWKTWLQIILDAAEIGYLGSFNFFQQPGIDTTAAARTAAPVSQTQVEVAIAAADGDLNVAVEILMIQHVNKQRFYGINGENCGI